MSIHKRLRSLASELWDTDSDLLDTPLFAVGEPSKRNQCGSCCLAETTIKKQFEVELDGLRQTILQLEAEKLDLRDRIQKLKDDLSSTTLQLFEVQKFMRPIGGRPGLKTEPATADSWLSDIGHLIEQPSFNQFYQQWVRFASQEITFALCKQDQMNANRILSHCEWVVHSLGRKHPVVYKIGITENVIDRWCNKPYCYKSDKADVWHGMVVLFVGADSLTCGMVESFLIHRFLGRSGCRNSQLGGETAKPSCNLYFTYCVYRILAPPLK